MIRETLKPGKNRKACLVEGQKFDGRGELGLGEYLKWCLILCYVRLCSKVKVSF